MDPLGRMLLGAEGFRALTLRAMEAAGQLCGGRLAMTHEGGYSEVHVPFCGHAVLEALSGSAIAVPDPLGATIAARQPDARWQAPVAGYLAELAAEFGL
jgi:acetoin utilization deacetylase AcuC-like enzyme